MDRPDWNEENSAEDRTRLIPDIIEFVCSDQYLNRNTLYPRQGTLLKLIFLQDDLFCADEETEILTRRGWVTYGDLDVGEDVMTLNMDTGLGEWGRTEKVNVFPVVNQELVRMEGASHSSLTTPNHRWPTDPKGGSRHFVETSGLRTTDRVTCAEKVANLPVEAQWDDAFVELVAWYWTEGHRIVGHSGVRITQSIKVNPEYVDRIRMCLTKLFGPASDWMHLSPEVPMWREDKDGDMTAFRLNSLAGADLRWVAEGDEKVVQPTFLATLTQEQLGLFIETSLDADGWRTQPRASGRRTRAISQKSKRRLDSFQMACSLAGIRTVLRECAVRGSGHYAGRQFWQLSLLDHRRFFTPQHLDVKREDHTGIVWCPTTKNGTWLARRGGSVYFTGNTDYDKSVLREWSKGFRLPDKSRRKPGEPLRYEGGWGLAPDWEERLHANKAAGRHWFREVLAVMGRRSGKGHIGGICGAAVLWFYIQRGWPHLHYGFDRSKTLTALTFAAKKDQAKREQWADITNVITGAPCFAPYISRDHAESLTVYSRYDGIKWLEKMRKGMRSDKDFATFALLPKESTSTAGRGPATFMQHYDEMAWVVASGSNRSAEEVYQSATPALDTFGVDAFLYEGSSPWQMMGQFYDNWLESLTVDPDTLKPLRPEMLMLQLASWDIYKDWHQAPRIVMVPKSHKRVFNDLCEDTGEMIETVVTSKFAGHPYPTQIRAQQSYDSQMKLLEASNPEKFKVERRAQWATALDAYLNEDLVRAMFEDEKFLGGRLTMQSQGRLRPHYVAHGDPSESGANFGFALAHLSDKPDGFGLYHVIFDFIHAWRPSDYDENDYQIDYTAVEEDLKRIIRAFQPHLLTFDQFNSAQLIQRLRTFVRNAQLPKQTTIEKHAATAPLNWAMAETFKTALGMGLIHAPYHDLADLELRFLQKTREQRVDKPSTGPIQTKDVADAMFNVTYHLIGEQMGMILGGDMSGFIRGAAQGGIPTTVSSGDAEMMETLSSSAFASPRTAHGKAYRG